MEAKLPFLGNVVKRDEEGTVVESALEFDEGTQVVNIIYSYLPINSKGELDFSLKTLTPEEKKLLLARFDEDDYDNDWDYVDVEYERKYGNLLS